MFQARKAKEKADEEKWKNVPAWKRKLMIEKEKEKQEKDNQDYQKVNEPPHAVLKSTHHLCFGSKIRKIGIPLHTPVLPYYIELGFKWVFIAQTSFPDDCVDNGVDISG